MKLRVIAIMALLMACATFSYADITSNSIASDGDGVILCNVYTMTQSGDDFFIDIDGEHYNVLDPLNPGHIQGDILSDSETLDPKLTLTNSIDNDTGEAWGDYHVKITMTKSFTLDNVGVNSIGWTVLPFNQPTQVGSDWIGYIDYVGYGNPILATGTLDFGYRMTYLGSTWFQEELTPSPVPEPGTFVLLACGLMGLLVARRRFA